MFYSSRLRPLHFVTRESAYALASPHHLTTVCFKKICHISFHLHFSKIVPRTDARILPSENSHPLFRFEENSRVVKKHDVFSQRSCLRPLTRESAYALASPHHLATISFKIIRHLHSTRVLFVLPPAAPLRYAGIGVRTCFASSFGNRMFQKSTSYFIPFALCIRHTHRHCDCGCFRNFPLRRKIG